MQYNDNNAAIAAVQYCHGRQYNEYNTMNTIQYNTIQYNNDNTDMADNTMQ